MFNNPLKYIDPTGYKSKYYRDWNTSGFSPPPCHGGYGWNFYYNNISPPLGSGISSFAGNFGNPFSMGGGNWVNSFSGGRLRPPGFGINGPGFGGIYYDWYSGTYQSTNGLGQLHWRDAYDVLTAHHLNPGGKTLPPINVIGSGRYGSGRIIGGVPKWWGDHPARYPGGNRSYFNLFNTLFSVAASRLGTGMDGLIRNMEKIKSESKALARAIDQKGPWGNYSSPINKLKGIGLGLKWIGRLGPLINAGHSIYLYDQNKIDEVRLGYDLTVSGISYFPVVGPWISNFNLLIDQTIGIENAHQFIIDQEIHRANMARSGFMPPPRR